MAGATQGATQPLKIVLTGAPGSGKSTIARALADRHPKRFIVVPEAATQYYSSIDRKWNQLDVEKQRDAQRSIYRLQVAQESRFSASHPNHTLLLDRGTIDGAAYWPDGPAAYWTDLGSTEAAEFARYRLVIVLETAAAIGLYDGDASNHVRFEGAAEALENAKLLQRLWSGHPEIAFVKAEAQLERKIAAVESLILAAANRR